MNKNKQLRYHMQQTVLRYVTPFGSRTCLNLQRFQVDILN
jgi:hypothetical protein